MSLTFDLHRRPDPASDARRAEIHADPGFGVHFTDHMLTAVWHKDGGWGNGRVEPYGPISVMPSAAVLL
jgi:branched-chain amino acid aminotransferase